MNGISPLQLNRVVFTDVRLSAQPDAYLGEDGIFNTQVEFGATPLSEDRRQWNVIVRVNLKPADDKKPTYLGTVEAVGHFEVNAEWPKEQVEKLVVVNGTSILYGSIRELVMTITARGPWPPIMLVSQSFVASYEQNKMSTGKASAGSITASST